VSEGWSENFERDVFLLRRRLGMSEKRYMVPEGMLKAAVAGLIHCWDRIPKSTDYSSKQVQLSTAACEAALRWLSENPIVPTDDQRAELSRLVPYEDSGNGKILSVACVEFQRRMFLAPEPEVDRIDFYYKTSDGEYKLYEQAPDTNYFLIKKVHQNTKIRFEEKPIIPSCTVEPGVPESVARLFEPNPCEKFMAGEMNQRILEAYRRGRDGK